MRIQTSYALLAFLVSGCSTPQPTEVLTTQPELRNKEVVVVNDVRSPYASAHVNHVWVKLLDIPMEISLQDMGNGKWEHELSRDEIARISAYSRGAQYSTHPGKLVIESGTAEFGSTTTEKPIEIQVKVPNATG